MSEEHTPDVALLNTLGLTTLLPVTFDDTQLQAINACCDVDRRVVAVTGKAGTGKTMLIKEINARLTKAGYTVACSAPTGKAARRIQETCGIPAQTNHRLLGYGMPIEHTEVDEKTGNTKYVKLSTGPKFTRASPLPYDVLLCDEYAMVNQELHRNLINALKPGARICMFGDRNQLKPIEENRNDDREPSAFEVCIDKFKGIELTTIHRQTEGSGIADNGARVLAGRLPVKHERDFDIRFTSDPVHVVREFVLEQQEAGYDYSTPDYQIITCMNKSWIGTKRLNQTIQALFWDRLSPSLTLPRHVWGHATAKKELDDAIRVQVGTKVVYTANTYDLGNEQSVFNGELGNVIAIDENEGSVEIDMGDRTIVVPPLLIVIRNDGTAIETDPRKNIDLAYVLTTHKVQGSEFNRACYVINRSTQFGQSRRNMYTAITRSREHCTLITDQLSIMKSVKWAG
jgi:exodeoxyribonuclease V alpha subunit